MGFLQSRICSLPPSILSLNCHAFNSKFCWQRDFTTVPIPLMAGGNYLLRDAIGKREKRKWPSRSVRVSVDNGMPWIWEPQHVLPILDVFVQKSFSSMISYAKHIVSNYTCMERPKRSLRTRLEFFSGLLVIALTGTSFVLWTGSALA